MVLTSLSKIPLHSVHLILSGCFPVNLFGVNKTEWTEKEGGGILTSTNFNSTEALNMQYCILKNIKVDDLTSPFNKVPGNPINCC